LRAPELRRRLLFQLRQYRDITNACRGSVTALRCIAYRSRYVGEDIDADISLIRQTAHQRNPEWGLTGALVAYDDRFFQVLEGPREAVGMLFARIKSDLRHTDIRVLIDRPAPRRTMSHWSMSIVRPRRGCSASEGEFDAILDAYARDFLFDAEDAVAVIEAIAALPETVMEAP
jgi:hypothetical protein